MDQHIHTAIALRSVLKFRYRGASRTVYPYACGVSQNGIHLLVAWQISGRSDDPPGWRVFNIDRLVGLRFTGETFPPDPVDLGWARIHVQDFHDCEPGSCGRPPVATPPPARKLRTPWGTRATSMAASVDD